MSGPQAGKGFVGTLDPSQQGRAAALNQDDRNRGVELGARTCDPLETLVLGTSMLAGLLEIGHLPFVSKTLVVQASDSALGSLQVGIYRVVVDDLLPGPQFTARLAAQVSVQLTGTMQEYVVELPRTVEFDRTQGAWYFAVAGSTATVQVRGRSLGLPTTDLAWTQAVGGVLPPSWVPTTRIRELPFGQALSIFAARLRGPGVAEVSPETETDFAPATPTTIRNGKTVTVAADTQMLWKQAVHIEPMGSLHVIGDFVQVVS